MFRQCQHFIISHPQNTFIKVDVWFSQTVFARSKKIAVTLKSIKNFNHDTKACQKMSKLQIRIAKAK